MYLLIKLKYLNTIYFVQKSKENITGILFLMKWASFHARGAIVDLFQTW